MPLNEFRSVYIPRAVRIGGYHEMAAAKAELTTAL
jgi:hypothetical protein